MEIDSSLGSLPSFPFEGNVRSPSSIVRKLRLMMTVSRSVGRLCEVRFQSPLDIEKVTSFTLAIRPLVSNAVRPLVFCCDWRGVTTLAADIADTLVWIMRRDNPMIECNAILVDVANAETVRQAKKIVTEARHPNRKVFTKLAELRGYVDPMLDAPERRRLDAFFSERP